MITRLTQCLVEFAGRRPWLVVFAHVLFALVCYQTATHLQLRTDLLELLPRESPGFQTFERQLNKLGGGATLLVIVESPDAVANRRFIDDLATNIRHRANREQECHLQCVGTDCQKCPEKMIARVESDTRDISGYLARNRWLYVPNDELKIADDRIDEAIAKQSGLVPDLDSDGDETHETASQRATGTSDIADFERAIADVERRFSEAESRINPAPSGYFESSDGKSVGLRIVANSTPLGDVSGDRLLAQVKEIVAQTDPPKYHPLAHVGFAGDIPNSMTERESLASDALWATLAALALILLGIAVYFRSVLSIVIVGLPALIGVGAAFAFATVAFGYVNTTGAFLGAIILGNGVNYPIVLLSRYEEFVARGQSPAAARATAVQNAFRAELVGAAVASIAYGSLTVTRFRGFSQFGVIGCVGMALVWLVTIVLVPALLTLLQRWRERRAPAGHDAAHTRAGGPLGRCVASLSLKHPRLIVVLATAVLAICASALPKFLHDPWEYQFNRLGSRSSKHGGPGEWSVKAEQVFGGKMNVGGAMMLADSAEQAQKIKEQILAKDAADQRGRLIEDVVVIQDLLPGTAAEQARRLRTITRIRERLSDRVLGRLPADMRGRIVRLLPPSDLSAIGVEDLPEMLSSQFVDRAGRIGTVFYTKYRNSVVLSDGLTLLRIAAITDNVTLPDGTEVHTASRATIFAEMIRSMRRDGPLASVVAFLAVIVVIIIATHNWLGAVSVLVCLLWGVITMLGGAALANERLNFVNFIAIPITLGIGCEYPFNVYDRSRLLGGKIFSAVERAGMAVALCSYTTIIGYGSLLFADNQALQSFGRMAVLGEVSCVLAALILVPTVVNTLRRRHRGN